MNRTKRKNDHRTHEDFKKEGYYLITRECGCKAYVYPTNPEEEVVSVEDLVVIKACKNDSYLTGYDDDGTERECDTYGFWNNELWPLEGDGQGNVELVPELAKQYAEQGGKII
jgi:hypothetical protein